MTLPTRSDLELVIVDLDDTLYPQSAWLAGAWPAVAAATTELGADEAAVLFHLERIAAAGSDRGHIIDRALAAAGVEHANARALVDVFLAHRPAILSCYPGVIATLAEVSSVASVVVVTDGNPLIQRHKIETLGIEPYLAGIVVSDELDRSLRKPSPAPLLVALDLVECDPEHAVMIGDRPGKDTLAARRAGIAAIRVLTGEYASVPDRPEAELVAEDFVAAVAALKAT